MGRGAGQQQGQGSPGYNNPNAGGVGGQVPQLGGGALPPEMMVDAYRQMGRGAVPNLGRSPGQRANAFAPAGGPMNPDALPITASSGPASTQASPVAPTQSGITPPSPASGATGAAPPTGPAQGQKPGVPPGGHGPATQQQVLADTLRFG